MPDLVEPVTDVDDPRVADYRDVSDGDLMRRRRLFVAEGRLLETSLRVCSVLATPVAHESLADVLAARAEPIPVYVAPQAVLNAIAGFNFHRGCLAIGERHTTLTPVEFCERAAATRLIILDAIGNSDNVGVIFRNAAALGADGVLVGPGCCDPLYRKALRTSVGAEGDGLSGSARQAADVLLRIPTAPAVDSLNVTSAAGIALHSLRLRPEPATATVPSVNDYAE